MHYGRRDFSKNGKMTVEPKDSKAKIGQRKGMTSTDIAELNAVYKYSQMPNTFT